MNATQLLLIFEEIGQEKEVKAAADRSWEKRNVLELLGAGPLWRGLFAQILEFEVVGSFTGKIYETVKIRWSKSQADFLAPWR